MRMPSMLRLDQFILTLLCFSFCFFDFAFIYTSVFDVYTPYGLFFTLGQDILWDYRLVFSPFDLRQFGLSSL